ncbi:uncharacterized protein BYT42DRAFT_545742 [Radiomyces spectabilis]|uniref:uncharacterized protein n=1 Tax=Radiomyces spectabilis TaxID=64574 RepID=UPI00221FD070|nr:uncharacterized protein BYT42DRAFT_545742 [Radiomyces spectabilis]KAI8379379.1 hypothetical protein BYT42DRAFT_545742 [Radiomyces spectabilis]
MHSNTHFEIRKHRRSSSSESSSSSDSEDERRSRKRHKHKKEKAKKHKKDKKKSKKEKKHKSRAVGDDWGKYGIIHEADIFTKEAEFQAWLIEVKHADVETLNNIKRKEMFLDFMEDYNTATMPHDKFYDMSKWESRQHAVRMGDPLPPSDSTFNFANDEEQLRMQHRMAARMASSKKSSLTLSQEQIEELAKVNRERIQAERMRKMGLVPKGNMGVRYEYE